MATKQEESTTVREARHEELDRVYSKANPTVVIGQVNTVRDSKGKRDQVKIEDVGGAYEIEGKRLDRDGWLALAKTASRIAQAS